MTYHAEARAGITLKRMAAIFMMLELNCWGKLNMSFCETK